MKGFAVSLVFFFITGLVMGQGQPVFETSEYDFGQIREEEGPVSYTFTFVNKGDKAIKVTEVNASCGCTTPDWTREEVMPNDTGRIVAEYNPMNRPGSFHKSLNVNFSNGNTNQLVSLHISGTVKPRPLRIEDELPTKLGAIRLQYRSLNMGRLTTEKSVEKVFDVFNDSDSAVVWLQEQAIIPDHIRFRYEPDTLAPGTLGQLILTYDPKKKNDLGYVSDEITLMTDEMTESQKQLLVISTIEEYFGKLNDAELAEAPRLIFDKNSFDFKEVNQGSTTSVDFTLTNIGKTELQIRAVKSNCECVVTTPEKRSIAPGESITMQVDFDTSGRRGRQYKNITVFSNDPRAPTQVLSLKADVSE